jgi:hypothetical protein
VGVHLLQHGPGAAFFAAFEDGGVHVFVEFEEFVVVFFGDAQFLQGQAGLELEEVFAGKGYAGLLHDFSFEGFADEFGFFDLVGVDEGYVGAFLGVYVEEFLLGEFDEGFADRGAADVQPFGYFLLGDVLAGLEGEIDYVGS